MREALARNDYFQSEDLDHFSDRSCIFSRGVDREHLVSALEHLYVCEACRSFYERIDLKDECSATFKVLRKIDELRRDRSLDRRARTVIEQPESGK